MLRSIKRLIAITDSSCSNGARRYSAAASRASSVGFIGLGNMGFHMASNLLKAGFPLIVHDVSEAPMQKLVEQGARAARSPAEIAAAAASVITMLPSSPHVESVYGGASGLLSTASKGTLFIDTSTIDPTVARRVASEVSRVTLDTGMLDAPVSGGVNGAAGATLTFMVGGDASSLARGRPLLEAMGKKIVHCGASGSGQVAKVCNNLVLGISMIGVSEAMNLGVQLGIDPKMLAEIFNTSSARCWSSDTYNPVPGVMPNVPASRDYEGGFGVDLMAKDLGLAVAAANSAKAPLPLGGVALQLYNLMSRHNYGKKDFASVYKFLNDGATTTPTPK